MSDTPVTAVIRAKKAVVFDLFHTLTSVESSWGDNLPSTSELLSVDRKAWNEQLLAKSRERLTGAKTDPAAIIGDMARAIDPDIPDGLIRAAAEARTARFAAAVTDIPAETVAALEALKARGKLLGLVTNADVMEIAAWEQNNIHHLFDSTVVSCRVGLVKPEREIYEIALRELGVPAAEAVFVGDGGSGELQGARDAGMTAIMMAGIIRELWPDQIEARRGQADFVIERLSELVEGGGRGAGHIEYRSGGDLPVEQVLELYRANGWSSAEKPEQLMASLAGSHAVVTAWHGDRLVGLGNTLSDGHLVVYYSHLLVHPDYQGQGIGRCIAEQLKARYEGFHQHVLLADSRAVDFYRKLGFKRADATMPMWIYAGHDHGVSTHARFVLFDWGNTLMVDFPQYEGPMASWPHVEAVPHARETLEQVRALGWGTALATNAGDSVETDIRAALARVGLDALIDRVFCSREVGHNKPAPEFFAFIKRALALPDEDLVMVGDNFQKDIEGATRCGIRAVWFRPGQEPPAPAAPQTGAIAERGSGAGSQSGAEWRTITDLLELPGMLAPAPAGS